jgi:ataxin-10
VLTQVIKERSILCVKYLLEGNTENQEFVAQLEAKKVVSDEAVREAGYETEIIDGKVALKKMAKGQNEVLQ